MVIRWSYSLFLTIFLPLFLPLSLTITSAESHHFDYPSTAIPPVSWLNVPSDYICSSESACLKPILKNRNFICGFHCSVTGQKSCLFAVSIANSSNSDHSLIVWSSNRNNPVQLNAVLKFTREGDLILEDDKGVPVWSTNTASMSVSRLSLTEQGNMVLLDNTNTMIWQSFAHPTESLVSGQRFVLGRKLRSSSSVTQTGIGTNLSPVNPPPKSQGQSKANILGPTLGGIFGVLFLCILRAILVKICRRKLEKHEDFLQHISGLPTRFSYKQLKAITNSFSSKLGEGGFGSVFRGTLPAGDQVAVKQLDCGHVNKSFITEVQTIGSFHHFNLVSLIGFCAENFRRLLVYEYMSNGSLDQWIYSKRKDVTVGLSWQSRKKIILDIAKGLSYLHEDCNQKIIHLDIKPQNILLDEDFNAKLSDFGLSKLIEKNQSQVMTTMRGTPGYMAPEWIGSCITEKADVYSFGIVVLEIVCGRPNVDRSQPEDDMHLVSLFKRKAEEEQLAELIDASTEDMQSNVEEAMEMMKVVACCLQSQSSKRPSMSEVVKVLEVSVDNIDKCFNYDFSKISGPDDISSVSFVLPSFLSGPR